MPVHLKGCNRDHVACLKKAYKDTGALLQELVWLWLGQ